MGSSDSKKKEGGEACQRLGEWALMAAMEGAFRKITVLGPGLLGGSVGLAVRARGLGEVFFWGRSESRLETVRRAGFRASADFGEAIADADLVVLATPVDFFADLAQQLVSAGGNYLVTDVGSVKGQVHREAGEILAKGGLEFVGAHPMAGSEKCGFEEAREELFEQASCLVTDGGQASPDAVARVAAFWQALGCRVVAMSPQEHDLVVARISHLPHILAAVGAQVSLRNREEGLLGGGGLRDTTRVAGGDPAMWTGILLGNQEAVMSELNRATEELARVRGILAASSQGALQDWLQEAKAARDSLAGTSCSQ